MKIKLLTGVCLLGLCWLIFAQASQDFTITKSRINNSGGVSLGGLFVINDSIGQTNASNQSVGGNFSLSGGFWSAGIRPNSIFFNGFEN